MGSGRDWPYKSPTRTMARNGVVGSLHQDRRATWTFSAPHPVPFHGSFAFAFCRRLPFDVALAHPRWWSEHPKAFTSIQRWRAMQGRIREFRWMRRRRLLVRGSAYVNDGWRLARHECGFSSAASPGVNASSFDSVLRLRCDDRLPLHILRRIRPAPFQGDDVIHQVAGAAEI